MTVLTFQPQFHDYVRTGRKPHTLRKARKRPIKSGDRLSLRGWSGRPYCSPQFVIKEDWCTYMLTMYLDVFTDAGGTITGISPRIDRHRLTHKDRDGFAYSDGFDYSDHGSPWQTFEAWLIATHRKALLEGFTGHLIGWDTPDWLVAFRVRTGT